MIPSGSSIALNIIQSFQSLRVEQRLAQTNAKWTCNNNQFKITITQAL